MFEFNTDTHAQTIVILKNSITTMQDLLDRHNELKDNGTIFPDLDFDVWLKNSKNEINYNKAQKNLRKCESILEEDVLKHIEARLDMPSVKRRYVATSDFDPEYNSSAKLIIATEFSDGEDVSYDDFYL